MSNTGSSLAGPVTSKTQNRLRDSRFAQLDSLFGQSDAEPIDAFAFKPPRALDGAVAVRIRFHRRENFHFVTDVISNYSIVVRECVEIDLGPRWATTN